MFATLPLIVIRVRRGRCREAEDEARPATVALSPRSTAQVDERRRSDVVVVVVVSCLLYGPVGGARCRARPALQLAREQDPHDAGDHDDDRHGQAEAAPAPAAAADHRGPLVAGQRRDDDRYVSGCRRRQRDDYNVVDDVVTADECSTPSRRRHHHSVVSRRPVSTVVADRFSGPRIPIDRSLFA